MPQIITRMATADSERVEYEATKSAFENGIYFDVPRCIYDCIPAANQSMLKTLLKETPAHARAAALYRVEKDAWIFGTAFDTLIFDPDTFEDKYVIWTGPIKRGKVWDAFAELAEAEGKIVLRKVEMDSLSLMQLSLLEHNTGAAQFSRADANSCCLVWTDDKTGLRMKALLDQLMMGDMPTIADLKTMISVAPGDLERVVCIFGYDVQAATYQRGCMALGMDKPNVILTCVEKEPKVTNNADELRHAVRVVELDTQTLARGNTLLDAALDLYSSVNRTGNWDSYPDRIELVSAPAWALKEVGQ